MNFEILGYLSKSSYCFSFFSSFFFGKVNGCCMSNCRAVAVIH